MLLDLINPIRALYDIFKRNIDRSNDVLKQRKELASQLMENCRIWASILLSTFDEAVDSWSKKKKGKQAAMSEIMKLEDDFLKLDYWSLESSSPILVFLKEDGRFENFAESCAKFYQSALSVKRMAYGGIEASPGLYVNIRDAGIKATVDSWKEEVERMLRDVSTEYMRIRTIEPK